MQNGIRLLEAIGYIQDAYILDAHSNPHKHVRSHKKILLIAAIVTVLFLLAGCAAYIWNWYTVYFTQTRQEPLSDSQVDYINENTKAHQSSQTYNGYTVALESTISDSRSAYVTFHLTAPEDVDLSPVIDPNSEERLSLQKLLAISKSTGFPVDLTYDVLDDGDNRANTLNIVLNIDIHSNQSANEASVAESIYCIEFSSIIHWGYDQEYEQELLSSKYAGETEYILESEESNRIHPQTILATGEWTFTLDLGEADTQNTEVLHGPISTKALVVRVGSNELETIDAIEDIVLTSVKLTPFGIHIEFEKPEPVDSFDCVYINLAQFSASLQVDVSDEDAVFVIMKDGTKINYYQEDGAKDTIFLEADSPVVLSEVAYLRLADGTKISVTVPK